MHYFFHDPKYRDKDLYKMIVQETHLGETYWHLEILDYDVLSSFFSFEFAKMNFDQKTLIDSSAQVSLNCKTTEQQASKHSGQDIFTIRCIALRFYIH